MAAAVPTPAMPSRSTGRPGDGACLRFKRARELKKGYDGHAPAALWARALQTWLVVPPGWLVCCPLRKRLAGRDPSVRGPPHHSSAVVQQQQSLWAVEIRVEWPGERSPP